MKKFLITKFLFLSVFLSSFSVSAQGILTASSFFKSVSENYSTIKDYEADVDIKAGKTSMRGKVSYKKPNLLRIDFSSPEDQVICFNGDVLTIYIKEPAEAVLQQQVTPGSTGSATNLSTPQGLSLMSRYYTVAYETGQNAEPLEEGSDEMVVKLILTRKSASEAFRYIKLAINNETKLIRRIEAVTPKGEEFVFDFFDYVLNQNLSEQRFVYDAPSSANNYNNFLFTE